MTITIYLYPFVIFFGIASFYLVWRYAWINYFIDEYRLRLFKLRDALFSLMKKHNLPPSSDLYRELRRRINHMIKFANHFTFLDIIRTVIIYNSFEDYQKYLSEKPHSVSDYISLADEFGKDLNQELKEELKSIEASFYYETFIHLFKRTPFLWPIFAFTFLTNILKNQNKSKVTPSKKLANQNNVSLGHKIFDTVDNLKHKSDIELAHF